MKIQGLGVVDKLYYLRISKYDDENLSKQFVLSNCITVLFFHLLDFDYCRVKRLKVVVIITGLYYFMVLTIYSFSNENG